MARSRATSGSPTGQRQQPGSARHCWIQCPVPPNPATQTRCPWRQRSPAEFSTQALPLRPGQQPNARSGSPNGPLVLPNGLRGRGASPKCGLTPLPPKSLPPPSARGRQSQSWLGSSWSWSCMSGPERPADPPEAGDSRTVVLRYVQGWTKGPGQSGGRGGARRLDPRNRGGSLRLLPFRACLEATKGKIKLAQ